MTVDGVQYVAIPARIEKTFLGWEDHGMFTLMLDCAFPSGHQGMGHIILSNSKKDSSGEYHQEGTLFGINLIMQILTVVGVEKWEDLPGKRVVLLKENEYGYIRGIANIDNPKGNYLIIETVAKEWKINE
jgi:hypothetical protein